MDNLGRLQKLTLSLIIGLVWFALMCFTVIFMANVFKWSFLSTTFSMAFFSAFGIGLGALVALAILHLTLTLNSISHSISTISKSKETASAKDNKFFVRSIVAAVSCIFFILLILWYGEVNVNRHKIKVALNNLESVAKSPLAIKLTDLINKDATVKEVMEVRGAMMNNLEDARGLSLLIPISKTEKDVYYELAPWWGWSHEEELKQPDKTISQANLMIFVPQEGEKKKFNQFISEKKPFYNFNEYSLRVFYPITVNGKIECVLLLDTSRQASDQYLLKRSRQGGTDGN